jgi:hypothetical protein
MIPKVKLFFVTILIGSQICHSQVLQQQCNPNTLVIDTVGDEINWGQFPDFSLPFTVVYHGDAPTDSLLHPLNKGFSHIGGPGFDYKDTIWPHQRAYTWTNIIVAGGWAAATNQPWYMIKSPWENDIDGFRQKWTERLEYIWNNWYIYNPPSDVKEFDIVIADIEWAYHDDDDILSIKYDPLVPVYYQELSDSAFIAEYKIAMAELYAEPLQLAKDILHPDVILSTYNETPIRRTWTLIDDYSWIEWISDSSLVDYLMNDPSGFLNSHFYQLNDWIAPSCYYYHDVDSLAIDAVDKLGYIDPNKVAVGGYSYGAFMVANLLSHSNLFAAGIARSGAYNRTLTPFGFQSEERNYWEAPEVYYTMSPFMHTDKMKTPLLLIHGEADNNSGTYPLQSERYFNALKGLGAPASLVMLPKESHGYRAKESIMHLLWEQDQWLDEYVKNREFPEEK